MQSPGSSFLHSRNPKLHSSDEVEVVVDYLRSGGESIPNDPADKISSYLGFLANRDYVNDGILTGDQGSIDRQIGAHVIETSDVPEGYFDLQRRIAREQGHGDVSITSEMRRMMTESVQADQRAGLSRWVEYLGGEDGGYPNWFKTYIWESVVKLGNYDKDKQQFQKRSRGTTASYPELNREALAYVYDVLNKSRVQGEKVDGGVNNKQLQKHLKSGNFGKLYAYAVMKVTPDSPELREDTRGSWVKFNQTDDPRTARRLSGSLQGHGTGWCTAGESTASMQLRGGDFYVYYTRDEDGNDTVPRVAIRMKQGKVFEVRGVNAAQELESVMADTTVEKLQSLPAGEEYIRKAEDMKFLTVIERKIADDPNTELTSEELSFLYQLDHKIQGFGYSDDPRVKEILSTRGDRDRQELVKILPESIRKQLSSSFSAYKTVAEQLSGKQRIFRNRETLLSPSEFERLFVAKDKEWKESGVYDYLVEQLIQNGTRFTLLATPNGAASEAQVVALAEAFGLSQPYRTRVHNNVYRRRRYSGPEWSGNSGDAPIRLSLIPDRVDTDISHNQAGAQLRLLRERQESRPELRLRVPSLLDAVTYWYTLRASGDILDDDNDFDRTYIRHFDLEPKQVGRHTIVPVSCVENGEPRLSFRNPGREDFARLAVG